MYQECPNCREGYKTVLERKNNKPIQEQYPDAQKWQREQLISGICSQKCWEEFIGLKPKKKTEIETCLNKCKFFRKYKKGEGTDSGHDGNCHNFKAIKMFDNEEGWDYSFDEIVTASEEGPPVFDIYGWQNRECPHYEKKGKRK